jgi:RimJ/RimL family protein N-acetyltransferase
MTALPGPGHNDDMAPLEPQDLSPIDWPVRTERLLIRPATEADADAVFDIRTIEEVGTWLSAWPRDREDYRGRFVEPGYLTRTLIVETLDGEQIGDLFLSIRDGWAQRPVAEQAKSIEAEIGWCFHPDHQGKGYATESVSALLDLCFGGFGLRRVTAVCFAINEPSWRLMERLGMRREAHTIGDSLHASLGWLDGYTYALLAEERLKKQSAP